MARGHNLWLHFGVDEHPFTPILMFTRGTLGFDPQPDGDSLGTLSARYNPRFRTKRTPPAEAWSRCPTSVGVGAPVTSNCPAFCRVLFGKNLGFHGKYRLVQ